MLIRQLCSRIRTVNKTNGEDVECHIEKDDINANERMIMNEQQTEQAPRYSIDKQPVELSDEEYRGMLEELNDEQRDIAQFVKEWCEESLRGGRHKTSLRNATVVS